MAFGSCLAFFREIPLQGEISLTSKFYFGRHEGFVTLSYVMSPKGPLLGFREVSVA